MKLYMGVVAFFSIGIFLSHQSAVRYVGWQKAEFLGKTTSDVRELAGDKGELTCYMPDLDKWRFGVVMEDLLLVGIELKVHYGFPPNTKRVVAIDASVSPRILTTYHSC